MLGIVNRAFLSRGASLLRPAFVRRMGVEANENPSVNGNVVLLAGITLAVTCGAFGWSAGYEPLVYYKKPKNSSLRGL